MVGFSRRHRQTGCSAQRGAALIVSLLMLVVTSIIGVNAMQTQYLEEQMAGNFRQVNLAFQATEAALRDAEMELSSVSSRINGLTGFDTSCTNGLCDATQGLSSVWLDAATEPQGVSIGTYTGTAAIAKVACQPRYWIEGFRVRPPGGASWKIWYRITAIGCGTDANTWVTLQTVYAVR
jgi:type IV pilus assembly protein PilX